MINLTEGLISDRWPKPDEEVQAYAYALQQAIKTLIEYADKTQCYSGVENLDEDTLDTLAIDFRAAGYKQEYDIEIKRKIIKAACMVYDHAGTVGAVKEFVRSIYAEAEVDEWYQYGGQPGHYRIGLEIDGQLQTIPVMSADEMYEFLRRINRLSAHLDGVSYIIRHRIELDHEVSLYQISPPFCGIIYCGTYPTISTRGYSANPGLAIGADPGEHSADPPLTGTVPTISTLGYRAKSGINIGADPGERETDPPLSGTVPTISTIGYRAESGINIGADPGERETNPTLSGTVPAGTMPTTATIGARLGASIASDPEIGSAASDPTLTGIAQTGTEPEEATVGALLGAGITSEPAAGAANANASETGTNYCGTAP